MRFFFFFVFSKCDYESQNDGTGTGTGVMNTCFTRALTITPHITPKNHAEAINAIERREKLT